MEDNTSQEISYNYSDYSDYSNYSDYSDYSNYSNYSDYSHYERVGFIVFVYTCMVVCIGLPLTLLALRGFYSLVRNGEVVPIYIINLFISDIIQFCCMIAEIVLSRKGKFLIILDSIYYLGLMASVGFMVCVALERYLLVVWPLWYRFKRTVKNSVVVCVMVWIFPLIFGVFATLINDVNVIRIIFSVFLLLPLPLFIFFLVGTYKALSAATSVPPDEKRRILAILVVVLLIYILLFLPTVVVNLCPVRQFDAYSVEFDFTTFNVSLALLKLSPVADLFLYVFSRKGAVDKLLSSLRCCRMDVNEGTNNTNDINL